MIESNWGSEKVNSHKSLEHGPFSSVTTAGDPARLRVEVAAMCCILTIVLYRVRIITEKLCAHQIAGDACYMSLTSTNLGWTMSSQHNIYIVHVRQNVVKSYHSFQDQNNIAMPTLILFRFLERYDLLAYRAKQVKSQRILEWALGQLQPSPLKVHNLPRKYSPQLATNWQVTGFSLSCTVWFPLQQCVVSLKQMNAPEAVCVTVSSCQSIDAEQRTKIWQLPCRKRQRWYAKARSILDTLRCTGIQLTAGWTCWQKTEMHHESSWYVPDNTGSGNNMGAGAMQSPAWVKWDRVVRK